MSTRSAPIATPNHSFELTVTAGRPVLVAFAARIVCRQAKPACRNGQLNSNVRPHKIKPSALPAKEDIEPMDKPLTEEDRTTAIGLARYAYEYIEAAMLVERNDPTPTHISPIPAYFLALHGIELTLKSYLRHRGLTVKELRGKTYGHDLHACHKKAKELGLHTVFKEQPTDADAMRMLVGLNDHQGLRYIKTGMKHFPLWSLVEPLAVRLHQAIAPAVGYKSFDITFHHPIASAA